MLPYHRLSFLLQVPPLSIRDVGVSTLVWSPLEEEHPKVHTVGCGVGVFRYGLQVPVECGAEDRCGDGVSEHEHLGCGALPEAQCDA